MQIVDKERSENQMQTRSRWPLSFFSYLYAGVLSIFKQLQKQMILAREETKTGKLPDERFEEK